MVVRNNRLFFDKRNYQFPVLTESGGWQATIDCLLVSPQMQGKGIASELLRRLLREYEDFLYIDVVPEDKRNAPFYEKHGFKMMEVVKVKIVPYVNDMDEYLKADDVIDHRNKPIIQLADELFQKSDDELSFIKAAYEFVRDHISHSADKKEDILTCTASEVLEAGHGICFAKSHLLAALLRCKSIPTGFCYQKLILDDETAPVLVYHGLNGVYIKELKKWIRLDARGNRDDVDAQFSIDHEQLAFPVRPEMGEIDSYTVYPKPDVKILEKLRESKTRIELWDHLPTELGYHG